MLKLISNFKLSVSRSYLFVSTVSLGFGLFLTIQTFPSQTRAQLSPFGELLLTRELEVQGRDKSKSSTLLCSIFSDKIQISKTAELVGGIVNQEFPITFDRLGLLKDLIRQASQGKVNKVEIGASGRTFNYKAKVPGEADLITLLEIARTGLGSSNSSAAAKALVNQTDVLCGSKDIKF